MHTKWCAYALRPLHEWKGLNGYCFTVINGVKKLWRRKRCFALCVCFLEFLDLVTDLGGTGVRHGGAIVEEDGGDNAVAVVNALYELFDSFNVLVFVNINVGKRNVKFAKQFLQTLAVRAPAG